MRPASSHEFDEEKFRELVLYISRWYEDELFFGVTKLTKVLFYSDFLAYKELGKAISGAIYLAERRGPVCVQLPDIRDDLERKREIAITIRGRDHQQQRVVPLRDSDLNRFTAAEIAIVDRVIEELRKYDAKGISEFSPAFSGWKAAWAEHLATGGPAVIRYGSVFVSNEPLDEFEEARALELAKKYGWAV